MVNLIVFRHPFSYRTLFYVHDLIFNRRRKPVIYQDRHHHTDPENIGPEIASLRNSDDSQHEGKWF